MKIGMITDSLPGTDFDTLLATAVRLELDMLEFGCGNWSSAPHLDLDRMLALPFDTTGLTSVTFCARYKRTCATFVMPRSSTAAPSIVSGPVARAYQRIGTPFTVSVRSNALS